MSEFVTEDDVRHIAELARVDLTDEEVSRFVQEFSEILEYFEVVETVPESEEPHEYYNVLRPDSETPSLSHDDALRNAEETEDGYFKGPRVS
jgi:aspartyl-tRNA(Asn)/glutamyl-tRNA(Gln) amidotransferase subunit C